MSQEPTTSTAPQGWLGAVERIGNRLPDPAVLFIYLLVIVWLLSWAMSYLQFESLDPRTGNPLLIVNQLSGTAIAKFLSSMVTNFAHFPPIGVVLVAMLGIGVAEHTGFINTGLRAMLSVTANGCSRLWSLRLP
jgi:aminobenzoyl-glutamate transport protein